MGKEIIISEFYPSSGPGEDPLQRYIASPAAQEEYKRLREEYILSEYPPNNIGNNNEVRVRIYPAKHNNGVFGHIVEVEVEEKPL